MTAQTYIHTYTHIAIEAHTYTYVRIQSSHMSAIKVQLFCRNPEFISFFLFDVTPLKSSFELDL